MLSGANYLDRPNQLLRLVAPSPCHGRGIGRAFAGVCWRVIDARSGRQTPCPFTAIALTTYLNDGAVVHEPVHGRHGHGAGAEDVLPLAERLVGCHQQGSALIAVHHQLKEHRGLRLVLVHVANIVNDEQAIAIELVERLGQGVVTSPAAAPAPALWWW
jgi:hypothetical protein